jgi:hypothetical protein
MPTGPVRGGGPAQTGALGLGLGKFLLSFTCWESLDFVDLNFAGMDIRGVMQKKG